MGSGGAVGISANGVSDGRSVDVRVMIRVSPRSDLWLRSGMDSVYAKRRFYVNARLRRRSGCGIVRNTGSLCLLHAFEAHHNGQRFGHSSLSDEEGRIGLIPRDNGRVSWPEVLLPDGNAA